MFRNQYDMDCITWNPKGKLLQVRKHYIGGVRNGSSQVGRHFPRVEIKHARSKHFSKFIPGFGIAEEIVARIGWLCGKDL
jgi:hypothetical protein